jgi:hypothetical protein
LNVLNFSTMRVSFAIVLTLVSLPAAAQQQIGTAHKVVPAAHGSVAGTLSAGAAVHADETIGTDKAGTASLGFNDQSNLDVGPNSSVKLNKFIYDPNRGGGKAVIDVAKGSFRFTTGAQGRGGTHEIKTPYGTLGIRG